MKKMLHKTHTPVAHQKKVCYNVSKTKENNGRAQLKSNCSNVVRVRVSLRLPKFYEFK